MQIILLHLLFLTVAKAFDDDAFVPEISIGVTLEEEPEPIFETITIEQATERCVSETVALDVIPSIQEAYSVFVPQEASGPTISGIKSRFLDYSTEPLLVERYQSECETNGGAFLMIDFEAECRATADDDIAANQMSTLVTEQLIVFGFPRCYSGNNCRFFYDQLFETFTLRTTEALNNEKAERGISWMCTGQVTPRTSSSDEETDSTDSAISTPSSSTNRVCDLATAAFRGASPIIVGRAMVTSSVVVDRAFFGLFETNLRFVNFASTDAFQTACEGAEGSFVSFDDILIQCMARNTVTDRVEEDIIYQAVRFPVCTSPNCNVDETGLTDWLEQSLVDNGQLITMEQTDLICMGSGALGVSILVSLLVISGAMVFAGC